MLETAVVRTSVLWGRVCTVRTVNEGSHMLAEIRHGYIIRYVSDTLVLTNTERRECVCVSWSTCQVICFLPVRLRPERRVNSKQVCGHVCLKSYSQSETCTSITLRSHDSRGHVVSTGHDDVNVSIFCIGERFCCSCQSDLCRCANPGF